MVRIIERSSNAEPADIVLARLTERRSSALTLRLMKSAEHLQLVPEKGSIRGAARMSGHDKGTICKWVYLASKHCKEVTDYFLKELRLDRVQVDEIWSYIKKRRKTSLSAIRKNTAMSTA